VFQYREGANEKVYHIHQQPNVPIRQSANDASLFEFDQPITRIWPAWYRKSSTVIYQSPGQPRDYTYATTPETRIGVPSSLCQTKLISFRFSSSHIRPICSHFGDASISSRSWYIPHGQKRMRRSENLSQIIHLTSRWMISMLVDPPPPPAMRLLYYDRYVVRVSF
jgi:hypothetical protein